MTYCLSCPSYSQEQYGFVPDDPFFRRLRQVGQADNWIDLEGYDSWVDPAGYTVSNRELTSILGFAARNIGTTFVLKDGDRTQSDCLLCSPTSLHLKGDAADFYAPGWDMVELAYYMDWFVKAHFPGRKFEVAWYLYRPHVHVGIGDPGRWGVNLGPDNKPVTVPFR